MEAYYLIQWVRYIGIDSHNHHRGVLFCSASDPPRWGNEGTATLGKVPILKNKRHKFFLAHIARRTIGIKVYSLILYGKSKFKGFDLKNPTLYFFHPPSPLSSPQGQINNLFSLLSISLLYETKKADRSVPFFRPTSYAEYGKWRWGLNIIFSLEKMRHHASSHWFLS